MNKGFTLIELIIVMAIVAILTFILTRYATALHDPSVQISFGINGVTETRCINGYWFVIGEGGQARQVMDEFGKGKRC